MGRAGETEPIAFLHRLQAAFYAENCAVTDAQVLADIAAQSGFDRETFLQAFRGEEAKQETWHDFASAQRAGITGFPTLIAGVGEGAPYALVTQGYQPSDRLIPLLARWLETARSLTAARTSAPS